MADNVITAKLKIAAEGLKEALKGARDTRTELDGAAIAAERLNKATAGSRMAAARAAPSPSQGGVTEQDYGKVRGSVGTGAAGRDFAKQAQGLGGLVSLYATFAANIFAVGAAYEALNKAAATERLSKATETMSIATGVHLKSVSKNLVEASGYALSFAEAMQFTNIGTSAGLASKQIESLTKIAKGAANALGRDVGDSVRRIIQGTAKQEQEILDELGIFVKADQAYEKYAKTFNIKVEDLTGAQRTQAYANEVERLGAKWNEFAEIPDPFSKFAATGKNALNEILVAVNKLFTPVLSFLSESEEGIKALIVLISAGLTKRALPELGNLFSNIFNYDKQLQQKSKADAVSGIRDTIAALKAEMLLGAKELAKVSKVTPLTGADIEKSVGALASARGTPGISTKRLTTALMGSTKENPIDITSHKTLLEVEKVHANVLKEQLRDKKFSVEYTQALIDKGLLANGATKDNIVLGIEGKRIAEENYLIIEKQVLAEQTKTKILAEQKLLQAEANRQEKRLSKADLSAVPAAKAAAAPAGATAATAAKTASTQALTAAELEAAAATAAHTAAIGLETAANTTAVTVIAAKTTATERLAVLERLAGEASANISVATTGKLLSFIPIIKQTSMGMWELFTATNKAGVGMGFFASMQIAASGASKILGLAVKGVAAAVNSLLMPLLLAYTAWELFGDTIKGWFGWSAEADKRTKESKEKLKEYAEGTGLAAVSLENLTLARNKEAESFEETARLDTLQNTVIREQIGRIKELQKTKSDAAEKATIESLKRKAELKGEVFSEQELFYTKLAGMASTPEQAKNLMELAAQYKALDTALANKTVTEQTAEDVQLRLAKASDTVLKVEQAATEQRQSNNDKIIASSKSVEGAVAAANEAMKKKGDPEIGIYSEKAAAAYKNLVAVFSNSAVTVNSFDNTLNSLKTRIDLGGKSAAGALPLFNLLNKILSDPKAGQQGGLTKLLADLNKELIASAAIFGKSLDTGKLTRTKSPVAFTTADKKLFAEMKDQIDLYTLSIQRADIETGSRKAIDARIAALSGFATAESIAAEIAEANSKSNIEYAKGATAAQLDYNKVLLDKTKIGTEGKEARAQALKDRDLKLEELKLTKIAREQSALQAKDLALVNSLASEQTKLIKETNDQYALLVGRENLAVKIKSNNIELQKISGLYTEKELVAAQNTLDILTEQATARAAIRTLGESQATALIKPMAETQSTDPRIQQDAYAEIARINALYGERIALQQSVNAQDLAQVTSLGLIKSAQAANNTEMAVMVDLTTSLTGAFGELGTSIGKAAESLLKMAQDDEKATKDRIDLNNQLAIAMSYGDREGEIAITEKIAKTEKKTAKDKVSNIINVASANKKMFAEHTAAYRILDTAEKVASAYKMAMILKEMGLDAMAFAKKIFFTETETATAVAGSSVKAGAELASEAATLPAKISGAVASLFSSSGWLAFGLVGAMMALIGSNSGGSPASAGFAPNSEQRQETQGTGTGWEAKGNKVETGGGVFGDSAAKSASIVNSLEILKDNSIVGLDYNNKMLRALENMVDAITAAGSALYAIPGLRQGGTAFGTLAGTTSEGGFGSDIPLIGGLLSNIIGGGTTSTTSIESAGIQLTGTFNDIIKNTENSVLQYKDVLTQFHEDGGWFGSDSDWTDRMRQHDKVKDSAAQAIGDVYLEAKNLFTEVGSQAGITAATVESAFANMSANVDIDLMGLKGDEIIAELNAVIGSQLDATASLLFAQFDKYKKIGEGFLETTIRVLDGNNKVDQALRSMASTFSILSNYDMSEYMIKAAGGLTEFMDQAAFFTSNFLTEAEQIVPIQASVSKELTRLGLSTSMSRAEFKTLVQTLDLSAEGGAQLYQSLMNLAPGFDLVTSAAETAIQEQKDLWDSFFDSFSTDAQKLTKDTATISSVFNKFGYQIPKTRTELLNLVTALKNTDSTAAIAIMNISDSLDAYYSSALSFESITKALSSSLDATSNTLKSQIKTLKDYNSTLLLGSQSTLTATQQYTVAKDEIARLQSIISTEATTPAEEATRNAAITSLTSASDTFLKLSSSLYASGSQYAEDFNLVQGAVTSTRSILEDQLTDVEKQQALLTTSNLFLEDISVASKSTAELLRMYLAAGGTPITTASMPSFAIGTNYVPSDMLAQIHTGERIIPAADNLNLMQNSNSTTAYTRQLVAQIESLTKQVEDLAAVVAEGAILNAKATDRNTTEITKVISGGNDKVIQSTRLQSKAGIK